MLAMLLTFKKLLVNRVVQGVVLGIGIFLMIYPFIPQIKFELEKRLNAKIYDESYYVDKYMSDRPATGLELSEVDPMRRAVGVDVGKRLIIPSIGVDIELVYDDNQDRALSKGAWVIPGSASPGESGQMVITGHRFQFTPPAKNTFYNLDKLKTGDTFIITYDGFAYKYQVSKTEEVKPEDYNYEGAGSATDEVVLYTCTPLWTAANRLIVHSSQVVFE